MKPRIAASSLAIVMTALALMMAVVGCKRERPAEDAMGNTDKTVGKAATPGSASSAPAEVQAPLVAGQFYPADPGELATMINSFLEQADPAPLSGKPLGFIAPHAGYPYSGPVAAYVYKSIEASGVKRFVIMGPSHQVPFRGVFVLDQDAYQTPLGQVRIDRAAARRLAASRPYISTDASIHRREHSIEVQLPFLQVAAGPEIAVTVIMVGEAEPALMTDLAKALNEVFPADDVIFIASSDMAHGNYPPYQGSDQIKPIDARTLELVKAMDFAKLEPGIVDRSAPLCGGPPVLALMRLFELRGGGEVAVLKYADSGDSTGDHSKVVGYGAVAFIPKAGAAKPTASASPSASPAPTPAASSAPAAAGGESGFALSDQDKLELLKMARASATAAVAGQNPPVLETASPALKRIGAAFVTLKNVGQLRGCIGTIVANEPLYLCVQRRATDAAIHDPRFLSNPITAEELSRIEIEISVLTPPTPARPDEIVVGRDGVLLSLGLDRGVFLPQVPTEQGWDHDQYLSHLCGKAGIADPDCWRKPEAKLERFQAIVFSESELGLK